MKSPLKDLQFVLCSGRNPESKHAFIYDKIYNAWLQVWTQAYADINEQNPLYSDTFTRQDVIAAVLHQGECLAFILFRHADLNRPATLNDSYFEQWKPEDLKKVAGFGDQILICGNFGIIPTARCEGLGFSVKALMLGYITEICLHSSCDIVISTPRRDKNINSVVYTWGGMKIAENVDWGHGVQVDLTAFIKQGILERRNHEVMPLVKELWSQRLVIREVAFEGVNDFENNIQFLDTFKKKKAA